MKHPTKQHDPQSPPDSATPSDEIPLPEEHFRQLGIASRPTFWRWEKEGLRVLRVNNRRFIYPSELTRFLEEKDLEAQKTKAAHQGEEVAK